MELCSGRGGLANIDHAALAVLAAFAGVEESLVPAVPADCQDGGGGDESTLDLEWLDSELRNALAAVAQVGVPCGGSPRGRGARCCCLA